LQKINAILRYHYSINPDELSDQEYAQKFQDWVYITRVKNDAQIALLENTLEKVLYKLTNEVFTALNKN